jgi:hypothetical protein
MKNVIVCCLLISLWACTTNKVALKEFVSKEAKFSIQYPATWQFDSTRYAIVQDLQDSKDNFQESVVLGSEQLPLKMSSSNYAKSYMSSLKILDSNMVQLQTKNKKIHNLDAVEVLFTTIQNNEKYKNTLLMYVQDSTAFTIQANALESTYASSLADINTIFNSIKSLP